jgi:hypothetical protein
MLSRLKVAGRLKVGRLQVAGYLPNFQFSNLAKL